MAIPSKLKLPVGDPTLPIPTPPVPPTLTALKIGEVTYNVNEQGDALDEDGKVIKTKAELEALKAPQKTPEEIAAEAALAARRTEINAQLIEGAEIELDGVKYVLNKDGNIEKDGKVFKTKADLQTLLLADNTPEDVDYVNEIQKATNLVILGQNNQPIAYENTLPGFTNYVQDVHRNGQELGARQYEETLFNRFPVLKSVIEHLTLKGSLDGFAETVDYSKITLTDDEAQQTDIYTKAQLARGVSMSEITDMLKYLKEDKKLKVHAEAALNYLKTSQTEASATRARQIQENKTREDQEAARYWNEVDTALTKKELIVGDKKFTLPEIIRVKEADGKIVTKSLKDFKDYITKPRNFNIEGKIYEMTQHDYDELLEDTKRTPHHDLFEAFRRFSKYDDSQIISANANSKIVKQVIKLTTKTAGGGSGTSGKTGKIVLPVK